MAPSLSLLLERGPCVQLSARTEAPINLQHVHSVLPGSERRELEEADGTVRNTSIYDPREERSRPLVRLQGPVLTRFDPVWCKLGHKALNKNNHGPDFAFSRQQLQRKPRVQAR